MFMKIFSKTLGVIIQLLINMSVQKQQLNKTAKSLYDDIVRIRAQTKLEKKNNNNNEGTSAKNDIALNKVDVKQICEKLYPAYNNFLPLPGCSVYMCACHVSNELKNTGHFL